MAGSRTCVKQWRCGRCLQGIFRRADWAEAVRLPLALVPGGSGNALSASTGLWSPTTAAHAIIKGRTQAMDCVSVLQPPGRRYYSLVSLNFGLICNLDIGTEHMRCATPMYLLLNI